MQNTINKEKGVMTICTVAFRSTCGIKSRQFCAFLGKATVIYVP